MVKSILSKKNKDDSFTRPDFKIYYKAIAIKTIQFRHKDRVPVMAQQVKNTT